MDIRKSMTKRPYTGPWHLMPVYQREQYSTKVGRGWLHLVHRVARRSSTLDVIHVPHLGCLRGVTLNTEYAE